MPSGGAGRRRGITFSCSFFIYSNVWKPKLLLKTLPKILNGSVTYQKQDESKVTFGYNITKEQEKIDFSKSKEEIKNLVRGLNPIPGAYCILDGKRMKIYNLSTMNTKQDLTKYKNGEIIEIEKDGIICKCSNGTIKITDISIEGKKRCKASEYINGINKKNLIGKVIE